MVVFLIILTSIQIYEIGIANTLPQVAVAVIFAALLDIILTYHKEKRTFFPSSAIITGLLISTGLTINTKLWIVIIITIIAVASKHIIKMNKRHIFNPADFGLLIGMIVFSTGVQWWASKIFLLVLFFGLFLTWKVRRHQMLIAYLITHLILSLVFSIFTGNLREYLLLINVFFILFMFIEPITSSYSQLIKIVFGVVFGCLLFLFYFLVPSIDPFVLSLTTTNLVVVIINKIMQKNLV